MAEVSFTNAAEADLNDIDEFSVTWFGEDAGDVYIRGFENAFARLGEFPLIGRALPDHGPGIHCLTHRSHQIFYRIEGEEVLVLRILHHARDVQSIMKSR